VDLCLKGADALQLTEYNCHSCQHCWLVVQLCPSTHLHVTPFHTKPYLVCCGYTQTTVAIKTDTTVSTKLMRWEKAHKILISPKLLINFQRLLNFALTVRPDRRKLKTVRRNYNKHGLTDIRVYSEWKRKTHSSENGWHYKNSSEGEAVNVNVLRRHRTCTGQSLCPLNWVPNFYYT